MLPSISGARLASRLRPQEHMAADIASETYFVVNCRYCEPIQPSSRTRAVSVERRACHNFGTQELPMNLVNHVSVFELAGLAPATGRIGSACHPALPGRSQ